MKKINKIIIRRLPDYDNDHDYLGSFSDIAGKFAVKHESHERHVYKYFNAENVENMKQAKQNYKRIMQYETGNLCDYSVQATAEIFTGTDGKNWLINRISSGGLYGLESDADESYFKDEEKNQYTDLIEVLEEFGFTKKEIKKVKIEYQTE